MNISESDYPVRWAICNKITRLKIKNDTQHKNIENQDLWKSFFNFAEVTTSNNHIFFRPLEEFEDYLKTKVPQHWPIGHLWDQTTNVKTFYDHYKDWPQLCGNVWQGDAQVPRWSGRAGLNIDFLNEFYVNIWIWMMNISFGWRDKSLRSWLEREWRNPLIQPSGAFYVAGREEAVRATPRILK